MDLGLADRLGAGPGRTRGGCCHWENPRESYYLMCSAETLRGYLAQHRTQLLFRLAEREMLQRRLGSWGLIIARGRSQKTVSAGVMDCPECAAEVSVLTSGRGKLVEDRIRFSLSRSKRAPFRVRVRFAVLDPGIECGEGLAEISRSGVRPAMAASPAGRELFEAKQGG